MKIFYRILSLLGFHTKDGKAVVGGTEETSRGANEINEVVRYFFDLVFAKEPQKKLPGGVDGNKKAAMLAKELMDARGALERIKDGRYDYSLDSQGFISEILKTIQFNLCRAAWIAHCVAQGNLSEKMDFLGEFSSSFNEMTQKFQKMQEEVRAQEERWRLAIECSRDGVFEINFVDNAQPFYSQRLREMHRCEIEVNGTSKPMPFKNWIEAIHPKDSKARAIFMQIATGEYKHDSWDVIFRMKDSTGMYCWRHSRGRTFFENDGRTSRIIGIVEDIHVQKSREEQFMYRATHDFLSGLPNRDLFYQSLAQLLGTVNYLCDSALLVVMVDLDYFKAVNDTMGHDTGDFLLQEFARRLQVSVRQNDIAARYGGDEFAMLLNCPNDSAKHIALIERIRKTLKAPLELNGKPYEIRASMGVAVAPQDGEDSITLLKCADDALYAAKRAGRDCYRFYSEVTAEDLTEKMKEEREKKPKPR